MDHVPENALTDAQMDVVETVKDPAEATVTELVRVATIHVLDHVVEAVKVVEVNVLVDVKADVIHHVMAEVKHAQEAAMLDVADVVDAPKSVHHVVMDARPDVQDVEVDVAKEHVDPILEQLLELLIKEQLEL